MTNRQTRLDDDSSSSFDLQFFRPQQQQQQETEEDEDQHLSQQALLQVHDVVQRRIQDFNNNTATINNDTILTFDNGGSTNFTTTTNDTAAAVSNNITSSILEATATPLVDEEAFISITNPPLPSLSPTMVPTTLSPSMAPTQNAWVTSTDTYIVTETLRVYGSFYILCFIVFCIVRKYYPRLFNIRSWVPEIQCDLATSQQYTGWIDWTWKVYQVSDEDMLNQCGLDALCFLRSLRLGWKLSLFGCMNAIWLLPLYITAESGDDTENLTDTFVIASVANIPSGNPRILAVVVAAYLMVFYALHMINKEYEWFIEMRHKFLSRRMIRNYAVYVAGIPPEFQSSFALRDYFQKCSWNSAVVETHIAMDIPKLEAKVTRRDKVVKDLEHVMAKERRDGVTQMHWAFPSATKGGRVKKQRKRSFKLSKTKKLGGGSGGIPISVTEKVNSVEAYQEELDQLNKEISSAINKMKNYNDKKRHHLRKSKAASNVLRKRLDPQHSLGGRSAQSLSSSSRKKSSLFGPRTSGSIKSSGDDDDDIYIDLSPLQERDEKDNGNENDDYGKTRNGQRREIEINGAPSFPTAGPSIQTLETAGVSTSTMGQLDPILESSYDASIPKQMEYFTDEGDSVTAKPTESASMESPNNKPPPDADASEEDDDDDSIEDSLPHFESFQRRNSPPHPFLELIGLDPFFYTNNHDDSTGSNTGELPPPMTRAERAKSAEYLKTDEEYKAAFQNIHDPENQEEIVFFSEDENELDINSSDASSIGRDMDGSDENTGDEETGFPKNRSADNCPVEVKHADGRRRATLVMRSSDSSMNTDSSDGASESSRSRRRRARASLAQRAKSGRRILGDAAKKSKHVTKKSLQVIGSTSGQVAGGVRKVADVGVTGVKRVAEMGANSDNFLASTLVAGGALVAESATLVAPILQINKEDGQPRDAGFVVFRDLYTTQAARQMLQHPSANRMLIEEAPSPDFVYWRNVGLSDKARNSGRLLSLAATIVLCFFWSIPMAVLSSLTEVNSLKTTLPFLARWTRKVPWLEGGLALIAPVLLLTLNEAILPYILEIFSKWEGHVGSPTLEAAVFIKLSSFVMIQTFFVSALSGSISAELSNILDNPEELVTLLANSLPAQSSYFIQIIFVFTFFVQAGDLLRVFPLGSALLRRFVGPNLTQKERKQTWGWLNSLEDPPDFYHAETFAQMGLFYVVYFVYATIAPITCFFLVVCFGICETGYRYHFIHNHKPEPDSGGKIWKYFIQVLLASMLVAEVTLLGYLALKKAVYAMPAMAPLLAITVLYMIFVVPNKSAVSTFLPTSMCVELDQKYKAEEEELGPLHDFKKLQYLQPALQNPNVYPDMDDDE